MRNRWFPLVVALVIGFNFSILLIPSCKSSNERAKPVDKASPKEDLIRNQQTIMRTNPMISMRM